MSDPTTPPEIPDAIVEKAARAIAPLNGCGYAECVHPAIDGNCDCADKARAALLAVAPLLRAQGMREAAKYADAYTILARAKELEEAKG